MRLSNGMLSWLNNLAPTIIAPGPLLLKPVLLVALVGLVGAGAALPQPAPLDDQILAQLPEDTKVLAVKTKTVAGQAFTFVKLLDAQGETKTQTFDGNRRKVSEDQIPKPRWRMINRALRERLDQMSDPAQKVRVNVGLQLDTVENVAAPSWMTAEPGPPDDSGRPTVGYTLNGQEATVQEVVANAQQRAQVNRGPREQERQQLAQRLRTLADRHGWNEHPAVREALGRGDRFLTMELTRGEIEALERESGDLVLGVELWLEAAHTSSPPSPPPPPVQPAMKQTKIDPDALSYNYKGSGVGIYMMENGRGAGCPNNDFITNYRRLSNTGETAHSKNVAGILRTVSPESYIYCGIGGAILISDLDGVDGHPAVYVASNSWGKCSCRDCAQSCSNPHATNYGFQSLYWDDLVYKRNVSVFFSAGNTGTSCLEDTRVVRNPHDGLNIVTVGAYDGSTKSIASFSCYGSPQIKSQKPEVSAPGVNIYAGGYTMSGTSQAAPHAAAFAANAMTPMPDLKSRPHLMKAIMLLGASDPISGGENKVGLGGIDFYEAVFYTRKYSWSGSNSSFFDAQGNVEVSHYFHAGRNYRIVLAWLSRGDYTIFHRDDTHPLGMDLDLYVVGEASSSSYDNPFEQVTNFSPTVSRNYTIRIHRYANRDKKSDVRMALVISPWWT